MLKPVGALLAMVGVFGISLSVFAATCYTRNLNGNWNNPTTWSSTLGGGAGTCAGAGNIPGANDDAIIANYARTYTVTANAACRSLAFTGGNRTTQLRINGGTTLTVGTDVILGAPNSGRIKRLDVLGGGQLSVGGNLTLNGGSSFSELRLGNNAATAVSVGGTLTSAGGTQTRVTFSGAGTLSIGDDFTGGGTFTAGTGTVVYNGNVIQTAGAYTYNHLTIANNGGSVSPGGALTVNGNFSVNPSATFFAGASTHVLRGNFTNNGSFNADTGVIQFAGSALQNLTGTTAFNDAILNNAAGLNLANNITVNGTLTFTSGNIVTGSNVVIIGSTADCGTAGNGGYVIGSLRKNFTPLLTNCAFEVGDANYYTPVNVTFSSVGTAGALTVSTTGADHAQITSSGIDPSLNLTRYWTLTRDATLAFTDFGAVFNFNANDVKPGANTANFIAQRYAGGWSNTTVVSAQPTSFQVSGATDIGDFTAGEPIISNFSREEELIYMREVYY